MTKFDPFTASVKAAPPAVALEGESEVRAGTGLGTVVVLIVKASAFEVPPPGAGFTTVTCAVPAVAMSAAVMAAVNWLLVKNVVVRLDPFH